MMAHLAQAEQYVTKHLLERGTLDQVVLVQLRPADEQIRKWAELVRGKENFTPGDAAEAAAPLAAGPRIVPGTPDYGAQGIRSSSIPITESAASSSYDTKWSAKQDLQTHATEQTVCTPFNNNAIVNGGCSNLHCADVHKCDVQLPSGTPCMGSHPRSQTTVPSSRTPKILKHPKK
eukprot:1365064-Amphidinium_carterae.1